MVAARGNTANAAASSGMSAAGETAFKQNVERDIAATSLYCASETWSEDVWPHVKAHYETMASQIPLKLEEGEKYTNLFELYIPDLSFAY